MTYTALFGNRLQLKFSFQKNYLVEAILLSALFAWIRLNFCYEYVVVPLQSILSGTLPKPFASRILMYLVYSPLQQITHLSPRVLFGMHEFVISLLVQCLIYKIALRSKHVTEEAADRLRRWFLPLLLILFVLITELPIYYPWDIVAVLVTLFAIYFSMTAQFAPFLCVLFIGALNRETALFLPLLWVFNYEKEPWKSIWFKVGFGVFFVLGMRLTIESTITHFPGHSFDVINDKNQLRVVQNSLWALSHPLQFLGVIGWLPIWIFFKRRRIATPYLTMLCCVVLITVSIWIGGNVHESRVFAEVMTVLYVIGLIGLRPT